MDYVVSLNNCELKNKHKVYDITDSFRMVSLQHDNNLNTEVVNSERLNEYTNNGVLNTSPQIINNEKSNTNNDNNLKFEIKQTSQKDSEIHRNSQESNKF